MMGPRSATLKSDVLVVDDTSDNLRLLREILAKEGYKVRAFSEGAFALDSARSVPPELILLDIKMPGMDGYEVCEQLKADDRTRDIPVIFISALQDVTDKVKGFSAGAVDYITKPFQAEEVLARVRTHSSVQRLHRELCEKNRLLEQSAADLRHVNATKDAFLSLLAHDLRNPFHTLMLMTEVLDEDFDMYTPVQMRKKIKQVYSASKTLYTLVQNLLEWSQLERGALTYTPKNIRLFETVEQILHIFVPQAAQKRIRLNKKIPKELTAYADEQMFNAIMRNLLSNALKFTSAGGSVCISARKTVEDDIEIVVSDTGIGMTQESLAQLFKIDVTQSTTGTAGEAGTGLGLVLCQGLVEKHGGTIRMESERGKGSRCLFSLPQRPWTNSDDKA